MKIPRDIEYVREQKRNKNTFKVSNVEMVSLKVAVCEVAFQ